MIDDGERRCVVVGQRKLELPARQFHQRGGRRHYQNLERALAQPAREAVDGEKPGELAGDMCLLRGKSDFLLRRR